MPSIGPTVDVRKLPEEIRTKLAQLDLELSEGDITEKGYEKKRRLLLEPFLKKAKQNGTTSNKKDAKDAKAQRHMRRTTRNESRYHSEIRQEAVQQALAEWGRGDDSKPAAEEKDANPLAIRNSFRPIRRRHASTKLSQQDQSNSSSDDGEEEGSSTLDSGTGGSRDRQNGGNKNGKKERKKGKQPTKAAGEGESGAATKAAESIVDKSAGPSSEEQPSTSPPQQAAAGDDDSQRLKDDTSLQKVQQNSSREKEKTTKIADDRVKKNMAGQEADVLQSKPEPSQQKDAAKPPNGQPRQSTSKEGEAEADYLTSQPPQFAAKLRNLPSAVRRTMAAECPSTAANRTSVLVLEDRPLPALPPTDDEEDGPEPAVYVNSTNDSGLGGSTNGPQDYANSKIPAKQTRVSQKIHQVLLSLQKPRKKPLQEYYNDDDVELEAMANAVDPSAPQPSGQLITPCRGDFPGGNAPPALPRSIDSVLFKWANTQPKVVAAVQLDSAGKAVTNLTYAKLLSRASKIAYTLLNRQVTVSSPSGSKERVQLCLPGDRVALVYPNSEAPAFLCAFYGCLLAGVVPVPIEVPTAKRDAAGLQQFGFLLGSCGVRVALTTERCLKGLPRMQSSAQSSGGGLLSSPSAPAGFSASSTSPGAATNAIQPGQAGHQGNINDLADFKGWPRLHWLVTEGLGRPAREWTLPSLLADDSMAYIEYSTDREGAVKGVTTSRQALLAHARALGASLEYKEGQTLICVVDFKREVGLWHACIAAVCHGMRVIFVPYSLMKVNPTCWLLQATRQQAQFALVKSRDLHWSLMAVRDHAQLQLNSLRAILVTDGANPWSLSSCDQFASTFKAHGLWPGVICPCAGSTEAGTVALRRPSRPETGQAQPSSNGPQNCGSGRGILSMLALSHFVVRVDQESSLSSLALQDTGQVVPGGMAVVVKLNGAPRLCRADEIGEICLHSTSAANGYHGLRGLSQTVFAVSPLGADDKPIGPLRYTRTGLVGFLGPEGLIFAVGNKQSLLHVSGRVHSADDLIATVLAVEPMKFIYRGRIAVFSGRVLRDERVCIVAEQRPEVNEEEAFGWMVRVLQAIDSIHQLGIYCLSLVPPNQLPKTPLGGIHVTETRQRFLDGCLHPSTLLMCPQNCVLNLPKPREPPAEVGPAAMFVGNIVQGVRIAGAQGRELQPSSPDESINLADILRQRAQHTPDHVLFSLLNSRAIEVDSLTCGQLLKRAERIAALLLEKGRLTAGDHVALIFPPGLDLIAAVFGCFCVSLVPVCIRPPSAQNLHTSMLTVRMIVDVSKAVALLSSSSLIKLLKSKEVSHRVNTKAWPTILDIEDAPSLSVARNRSRRSADSNAGGGAGTPTREPTDICYLDFAVSTTGQLSGVFVTTQGAANQCKSLKMACELYPSRNVTLCLDPYSGLGFSLWCLSSVFSGHQSSLIPPLEMEQNAQVWLQTLTQNKSRDTFCSYSVLEHCVRELAPQLGQLRERGVNLSSLRNCIVVAEERPRVQLCTAFIKLFAPLGLNARAVSTGFGCRVNSAICMQGAASPDPSSVYVDARALRNDRVTLVEKGAPHSICLMESGKLLPGVKVAIANPKTLGQCADTHLGEIWVASGHNAAGFFSLFGEETRLQTDHFNARLMTGDTKTVWARTGYLGFLRQTQAISADGELHDALFVVGSMDEMLLLRGMHYHPVDIELTVTRAHRQICESAAFTWTHLLVIVAETSAPETEALDLVPAITSAVLEEQQLIVGVVVVVDPGVIPMNSRGEKQRTHLRELFLKDQLDPIYVSYNL